MKGALVVQMRSEVIIARQQAIIFELEETLYNYRKAVADFNSKCTGIGCPLNDNTLEFNSKQINWLATRNHELESVEGYNERANAIKDWEKYKVEDV